MAKPRYGQSIQALSVSNVGRHSENVFIDPQESNIMNPVGDQHIIIETYILIWDGALLPRACVQPYDKSNSPLQGLICHRLQAV